MSGEDLKEKQPFRLIPEEVTGDPTDVDALATPFEHTIRVAPLESLIGKTIAGHYEIISCLGQGGMSTVYRAKHLLINTVRALKILDPAQVGDEKVMMRFRQEAKLSLSLEHPNIVRVYEFGIEPNLQQPYLVMDCLEGKSLSRLLSEKKLSSDRTIAIINQVCDALAHAHSKGIIHRDIKPGNIILVKDEFGNEVVKLLDFGIAKIMTPEGQSLTQTGEVFGTPLYMSPEQCLGQPVDARADIYSVGCIMFECLTGKPPFRGTSPLETYIMHAQEEAKVSHAAIPEYIRAVLNRCLAKDVNERYKSIKELKEELRSYSKQRASLIQKPEEIAKPDTRKAASASPNFLIGMSVVVLAVSATVLFMSFDMVRKSNEATRASVEALTKTQEKITSVATQSVATQPNGVTAPAVPAKPTKVRIEPSLPKELFDRLSTCSTDQERVNVLRQWKKQHPGFDYLVENELRHFLISVSLKESHRQIDLIMKNVPMDRYTCSILADWLHSDDPRLAPLVLAKARQYPDMKYLSAACFILAGNSYEKLGQPAAARECYDKLLEMRGENLEIYKGYARAGLNNLKRTKAPRLQNVKS